MTPLRRRRQLLTLPPPCLWLHSPWPCLGLDSECQAIQPFLPATTVSKDKAWEHQVCWVQVPIRAVPGNCPHLLDNPCQPRRLCARRCFSQNASLLPRLPLPLCRKSFPQLTDLPACLASGLVSRRQSAGSSQRGKKWPLVFPTAYPGDQRRSCKASRPSFGSHTVQRHNTVTCSLHLLSASSALSVWEGTTQGKNSISRDQPSQPHSSSVDFQSTNVGIWGIVQSVECLPSMQEALSSVFSTK